MIGEIAADLVSKVKSIASDSFGLSPKRVGLAVGGRAIDPLINKSVRPCAWVVFIGDENQDPGVEGECGPFLKFSFVVKVMVDYGSEADLVNTHFPLLEEVINAVNSFTGPLGTKSWKYEGQSIDEMTAERLVYDQRYSIVAIV